MLILEDNSRRHLKAFASELFISFHPESKGYAAGLFQVGWGGGKYLHFSPKM